MKIFFISLFCYWAIVLMIDIHYKRQNIKYLEMNNKIFQKVINKYDEVIKTEKELIFFLKKVGGK